MAFGGYFEYAGTEIINVARTDAYIRNSQWFRGCMDYCDLQDFLGDSDYTTAEGDEAPWYDPHDPFTKGFYGVYPIDVDGIENSTGTAAVTESILDGGVIGRVRYTTKTVVFNVALLGKDDCAVEAGFRWLKRVLAGNPCAGRLDSDCGGANLCYYSCLPCINPDCVPEPDVTLRTNWCPNPSAETSLVVLQPDANINLNVNRNTPSSFPAGGDWMWQTIRDDTLTPVTTPIVSSTFTPSDMRVPVAADRTVTFGVDVQVPDLDDSRFLYGYIMWYNAAGAFMFESPALGETSMSSAIQTYRGVVNATGPVGAVSARIRWEVTVDGGATFDGERVFYDRMTWETGTTDGSYFDGDSTDLGNLVYDWTGTPGGSTSTLIQLGDPGLPSSDPACQVANLRSLRGVTITTGPTLTAKRRTSDGSAVWTATFTAVAGNPFEYSEEQPIVEGFMDPAVDIPFAGGVVPDGGSYDEDGFSMSDDPDGCVVPTYQPINDPDGPCAIVSLPPAPPSIESCFEYPLDYTRRQFVIPPQYIPMWGDLVTKVEVHAREAKVNNLRIRFYPDHNSLGDSTIDPCNFCGDIVVSYIPKGDTLVLDGSDKAVYTISTAGIQQRADHLLFSSDGTPFDWPELTCGVGYIVTFDLPVTTTALPVIDLSLYDRVA